MVFLQPENSTGDQEIANLRTFEIEVQAPIRLVERLPRIVRLIEPCAVESAQSVQISAEMRRIPVKNHSDPLLMKCIDKVPEVLAAPITGGRCKERFRLRTHRLILGIFKKREQLDGCVPHLCDISGQVLCKLPVSGDMAFPVRDPEGCQTDLIDRDRLRL